MKYTCFEARLNFVLVVRAYWIHSYYLNGHPRKILDKKDIKIPDTKNSWTIAHENLQSGVYLLRGSFDLEN